MQAGTASIPVLAVWQDPLTSLRDHRHLDLALLDVKDRVRGFALRENLLVSAKRPQAAATIHLAKKFAHVERRLRSLRHGCLSPVSGESGNLVEARRMFQLPAERTDRPKCSLLNSPASQQKKVKIDNVGYSRGRGRNAG
jgi:hypothetical protein